MKKMKLLTVAAILCMTNTAIHAESLDVHVIDAKTKAKVKNTVVSIFDEQGKFVKLLASDKFNEHRIREPYIYQGKYKLKVIRLDEGYQVDERMYDIDVNQSVTKSTIEVHKEAYQPKIKHTRPEGKRLKVALKQAKTNKHIYKESKFVVENKSGEIVDMATMSKGIAVFDNLLPGHYTLKQIDAVKGYILGEVQDFEIPNTKAKRTTTVHYPLDRESFIQLRNLNQAKQPIVGRELALLDENGQQLATQVTNDQGLVTFSGLPQGTYKVVSLMDTISDISYKKIDYTVSQLEAGQTVKKQEISRELRQPNRTSVLEKTETQIVADTSSETQQQEILTIPPHNDKTTSSDKTNTTDKVSLEHRVENTSEKEKVDNDKKIGLADTSQADSKVSLVTAGKEDPVVEQVDNTVSNTKPEAAASEEKENQETEKVTNNQKEEQNTKTETALITDEESKDGTIQKVTGSEHVKEKRSIDEKNEQTVSQDINPKEIDTKNNDSVLEPVKTTTVSVYVRDGIRDSAVYAGTYGIFEKNTGILVAQSGISRSVATFKNIKAGHYIVKALQAPKGYMVNDRSAEIIIDEALNFLRHDIYYMYQPTLKIHFYTMSEHAQEGIKLGKVQDTFEMFVQREKEGQTQHAKVQFSDSYETFLETDTSYTFQLKDHADYTFVESKTTNIQTPTHHYGRFVVMNGYFLQPKPGFTPAMNVMDTVSTQYVSQNHYYPVTGESVNYGS